MRASIVPLLLAAAVVSGCAGGGHAGAVTTSTRAAAAARLKPPLLPTATAGSVAQFSCPKHPISTLAMESCTGRRILVLNARINGRIKSIWAHLGDAIGRSHFAAAEKAWLVYVKNECVSRSRAWVDPANPHAYVGGTQAGVTYGLCDEELRTAHLRELTETAAALAIH